MRRQKSRRAPGSVSRQPRGWPSQRTERGGRPSMGPREHGLRPLANGRHRCPTHSSASRCCIPTSQRFVTPGFGATRLHPMHRRFISEVVRRPRNEGGQGADELAPRVHLTTLERHDAGGKSVVLERVEKIWPLTGRGHGRQPDLRSRQTASTSGQSATEWPCGSEDMVRVCVIDHQVGNPDHQSRRPEPAQAPGPEPAWGAIHMEDWDSCPTCSSTRTRGLTTMSNSNTVRRCERWDTVLDEHFELAFSSRRR